MKKLTTMLLLVAAVTMLVMNGCANKVADTKKEFSGDTTKNVSSENSSDHDNTYNKNSNADESSEIPLILESNVKEPEVIEFSVAQLEYYESLKDYLKSDTAQEAIKKITASDDENNSEKKIYTENETDLVIETTIKEKLESKALKEFTDNTKSFVVKNEKIFIDLVDDLEACIKSNELNVIVRYKDHNGKIIYEHKFTNEQYNSSEEPKGKSESVSGSETGENTKTQ